MSDKPAESLRALAENKAEGITKATTFRVAPNLITFEEGFNLREDGPETEAHIDRLYKAMKAGAFLPPIDVKVDEGKIIARDGHCRAKAAQRLVAEVPEYTLECRQLRGDDTDAVIHMLGTGTGGKPLSPLEQGKGFLRLTSFGMKIPAIAEKLGVSRVTIDNGLTLAEAPVKLQKLISAGAVSSTTARDAMKQGKEGIKALYDAQEKAPEKKVTGKSLRGTKAEKKLKKKKSKKAAAEPDPTETPTASEGFITLTLRADKALVIAEFIGAFDGAASPEELVCLQELATNIETALI